MNATTNQGPAAIVRRLVSGGSWAMVGKIATYPLGLLLTMLLARLLTSDEVGAYFLAMSIVMLSAAIVQAGVPVSMSKQLAHALATDNPAQARCVIQTGIVVFGLLGIAAWFAYTGTPGQWLLDGLTDAEPLVDTLHWIGAMVVLFAAVGYCCESLRGFSRLAAASLLDQQLLQRLLLLIALAIAMAASSELALDDVLSVAAGAALVAAIVGTLLVGQSVRQLSDGGQRIGAHTVIREAPAFFLVRANNWLLNSAAVLLIGFFRPLDEAALFGAANITALLVIAPWQVVSAATGPTTVTLYAKGHRDLMVTTARSAAALATIPALILAAVSWLFGAEILALLFTSHYAAAAAMLTILACGRATASLFGLPMMLLSMTQHQQLVLRLLLFTSILTVAGYLFAVTRYGACGVAVVSAVSAALQGLLMFVAARKVLAINSLPALSPAKWKEFLHLLSSSTR